MSLGVLLFLSSGLFLGWSLGANDAANVFGTAVGSRMVRFRTAAVVCTCFVCLGAVLGGAGAAHTLGRLGAVNALGGAFTVALAAALATFAMTRLGLPVSTSQAVVGAIIGWNLYAGVVTSTGALSEIVLSWVLCPVLAAGFAMLVYVVLRRVLESSHVHLLQQDALVRWGLLVVGAFGSYSLGANNIANVMGVFVPENPFADRQVLGVTVTGIQQLFLLGGVAIGVGVLTYSEKVMRTVGNRLLHLSPEAALAVVLAQSLVLFLFASVRLEAWLAGHGLPTFPLVPVSSSQAVIGAILGLGLLRGGRGVRWRPLGGVGLGWLATPLVAGAVSFFLLFFVDNVFDQSVARPVIYRIDQAVVAEWGRQGHDPAALQGLVGTERTNALRLQDQLEAAAGLTRTEARQVIELAEVTPVVIDLGRANLELDLDWLALDQVRAVRSLAGRSFDHRWQLRRALADASPLWRLRPPSPLNRAWNRDVLQKLDHVERVFAADPQP
ncbi:MAG: anion permease [Candidatus Krumholzibacteriia bacterium]